MLSDKELSAIRERAEKAARGPWKAFIEDRDMQCGSSFIQTQGEDIELIGATEADIDFIANARQDIVSLLDEIEQLKGDFMSTDTTKEEHLLLVEADNDIAQFGKTEKKCPRCGNEIIIEDNGSAYTVRCKTDNCIKAEFRGI